MILEITPPPLGAVTVGSQPWHRVAAYCTGLVLATAVVGGTLGALGAYLQVSAGNRRIWLVGVALIALACGMHELAIVRLALPQLRWQVPVCWSKYGKVIQALLYGIVLGADIFTFIPYTSFYVLILFEMTFGPSGGVALGFLYGLARILPTVLGATYSHHRDNVSLVVMRILTARPWFHVSNGVLLTLVGGALLGIAVK